MHFTVFQFVWRLLFLAVSVTFLLKLAVAMADDTVGYNPLAINNPLGVVYLAVICVVTAVAAVVFVRYAMAMYLIFEIFSICKELCPNVGDAMACHTTTIHLLLRRTETNEFRVTVEAEPRDATRTTLKVTPNAVVDIITHDVPRFHLPMEQRQLRELLRLLQAQHPDAVVALV